MDRSPKAFPLGSPNARETVRQTVPIAFPLGEGCCRTLLPKPSPLGDRTPGKQSSGLFLVRSGRQAHGMVDFGGIACNSVERRPPPIPAQYCCEFPADCRLVKPFFVSIAYLVKIRPHPSALRAATFPKGEGCCRTVLPKPSPLGDRTPGKQSSGLFLVRSGRQALGPAGPRNGGFRRNCLQFCRKTNEVVCQASPLSHLHHLFYPPPITTQSCRGFPADCRQVKPFFVSITYLVRVRPHPSALRAATFPKGEGCCRAVPKSLPPWGRWPSEARSDEVVISHRRMRSLSPSVG